MRPAVLSICLAMAVAACANPRPPAPAALVADPAAERGLATAQLRCARCHDIGTGSPPALGSGPTFRTLRLRYNSLSLERRLIAIGERGHYDMPRLSLQPTEIEDLSRYIDTLSPP